MEMTKGVTEIAYAAYLFELEITGQASIEPKWVDLSESAKEAWRAAINTAIVENYLRRLDD